MRLFPGRCGILGRVSSGPQARRSRPVAGAKTGEKPGFAACRWIAIFRGPFPAREMLRMPNLLRQFLFASLACCTAPSSVFAQQPAGPVQLPAQFQLNAMEQGYLEQVLSSWQTESAKITIFQCPFQR